MLLSLGTGQRTRPRTFGEIKDWGLVEWARRSSTPSSTACRTPSTSSSARRWATERYWRLQVELTEASDDLDDAGADNLRLLRRTARSWRGGPRGAGASRRGATY